MNNISIADILELPVQERIRLVELIWDSVAAVPEAVKISPALKAELEVRLAEFEANPEAGYSWDEVKSRLKDGSWRTACNCPHGHCVKPAKLKSGTSCRTPVSVKNSSLQWSYSSNGWRKRLCFIPK